MTTYADQRTDVTGSPWRTDSGERWSNFPVTGLDEYKRINAGCSGCPKRETHNACEEIAISVPFGETRHQRVPYANRITIDTWKTLHGALWLAGYIHQPYDDGSLIFNAGAANNASQSKRFEIRGVSGSTLTLYGENPRRLVITVSSPNPDWPAEGGRLTTSQIEVGLPPGAMVKFLPPSVLESKLRPHIVSVNAPDSDADEVEFSIELSCAVSNATQPLDAAFPAPTYYVEIYWPELLGFGFERIEPQGEAQFSTREMTFTRAEAEAGDLELLDANGDPTRIIYPSLRDTAAIVSTRAEGEDWVLIDVENADFETTQGASAWSTVYKPEAAIATGDWDEIRIQFFAESTSDNVYREQWQGHCANDQLAPDGHAHDDGRRCTRVTSTQFDTYRAGCWQPDCDGFSLGVGQNTIGAVSRRPADLADPKHYSTRVWTREGLILVQGVVGAAGPGNFSVSLPSGGGPSLASLVGGWSRGVPGGLFASKDPVYGPAFGQRVVTESDGNYDQELRFGLFAAEPTAADPYVAGTDPTDGALPALVTGWKSATAADGGSRPSELRHLPPYPVGTCHLYNWTGAGAGLRDYNYMQTDCELIVAAIDSNPAISETVAGLFG